MKCPRCGSETSGNFCEKCGLQLSENNNDVRKKSNVPVIAFVLSIIGFILSFIVIGIVPSVIALILGIVSISKKSDRKGLCIASVVISIFTIILFFILIVFTQVDTDENITENSKEVQETDVEETLNPLEEKGYIEVGESFEVDGLKVTLNESSTDFQDYDNEYGWNTPTDGTKYIMASFTYENIGDSGDEYVSIYDFDCFADNSSCEQVYTLDDSDFMNTNLSPGRNVSFKVYFEVPSDSKSIELEYKESMWNDNRIKIKLQ